MEDEKVARLRLVSMFFVRCANDYWVELYDLKSPFFKMMYWGDVCNAFSSYWKKMRRENGKEIDDNICELVDIVDDKLSLIYSNLFNVMSESLKDNVELCTKVYIFDIFLTAAFTFARSINDLSTCKSVNNIKEMVGRFMGNFKFPYQSEEDGVRVYNTIEPYMLQYVEFLKTVKINVK